MLSMIVVATLFKASELLVDDKSKVDASQDYLNDATKVHCESLGTAPNGYS